MELLRSGRENGRSSCTKSENMPPLAANWT